MVYKLIVVFTIVIVGIVNCAPTENTTSEPVLNSTSSNGTYKGFFGDMVKAPFGVARDAVSLGKNISKAAIGVAQETAEKAVDVSLLPIKLIFGNWRHVHITGGSPAKQQDYPFVVSILEGNDVSKKLCGGVIVSLQHILTAAHCFDGQKPDQEYYVLTTKFKRPVKVTKIIKHECYDPESMFDDLALLELQSKFDNKTEIISLPESAQYNAEQVGKGKVLGSDSKSKSLVYLDVSVLTLAECSEYYTSIYSHQVCVINTKTNSCTAESGFPFIQIVDNKSILVGIASCSLEECAKAPSMYTRVDKYLSFINKSINGEKFVARC